MANRVRDILLVSSDYDAFVLEEDGRLSDRLFVEYSELNLVTMPNLVHVSTAAEAQELLRQRRFDLVLTTVRLEDPGVRGLSLQIKRAFPQLPVVLLALDDGELRRLAPSRSLDRTFLWTGDTRILLAIIKLIEDSLNVERDTRTGVPVIIVVEDSIHAYSAFLALLYSELMTQSQSLIAEGLNALHKLLRMRARPKVLLATTYEEAVDLFERYREHVLAVITDVRFPREGGLDPEAGLKLIGQLRALRHVPVLIHSAEPEAAAWAEAHKCGFLDKNASPVKGLQEFLKGDLGFGDFVFRLPDHTEVGRARDANELEQMLRTIDERSLHYHASHNHFNVWLRARCMFDLADLIQHVDANDFVTVEELRQWMINVLREAAFQQQVGLVSDFSPEVGPLTPWFMRLTEGSLGGKGRGVAFLHYFLARRNLSEAFEGLRLQVPRTLVVGTDAFDRFIEENGLKIGDDFSEGRLPELLETRLRSALPRLTRPLAVRSSSLLEDSQHQSCAGLYQTVFVPNNEATLDERLESLRKAIALVYASTWSSRAQAYHANTPFTVEDEKMGVVIQEVVGQRYGDRFYPLLSGVGLSWNHYPAGAQTPDDGVAMLALGLGQTIVEGGRSVRFAPGCPGVLRHLDAPSEFLGYSQHEFWALNMHSGSLERCDLATAEKDGTLAWAGSVYSSDDDQFRDNLRLPGVRVVTFNNILKWESLPLPRALDELLKELRRAISAPVEIEFALDRENGDVTLFLLQMRPLAEPLVDLERDSEGFPAGTVVCMSAQAVGHGVRRELVDVLLVADRLLSREGALEAAAEVASRKLSAYVLIGPGRWGSSDPALGIPVDITQIGDPAVMVELPYADRAVEPSQGSHFFHELISRRVGYLCLPTWGAEDSFCDVDWLLSQPLVWEGKHVRQLRLSAPLTAYLDGTASRGALLR